MAASAPGILAQRENVREELTRRFRVVLVDWTRRQLLDSRFRWVRSIFGENTQKRKRRKNLEATNEYRSAGNKVQRSELFARSAGRYRVRYEYRHRINEF